MVVGIGKTTADKLLRHFKSVKKIREATEDELSAVLNKTQVKTLIEYFNQQ
jgi:excinuclease ABC subunit C